MSRTKNTFIWLYLIESTTGTIISILLLQKVYQMPLRQQFMVKILAALAISNVLNAFIYLIILIYPKESFDFHSSISYVELCVACISGSLAFSSAWALCFKYWQTAFQMKYLFRIENEERNNKHNRLFIICNIIGYTLATVPMIIRQIFIRKYGPTSKEMGIATFFIFIAQIYTISFFFAAIIKMQHIFKQIPLLKKSEKVFIVTISVFVFYTIYGFIDIILSSIMLKKFGDGGIDTIITFQIAFLYFQQFFFIIFTIMVGWIGIKYSQPLMTRKDLKSQKNVTLLLFIRSRYDMRKIFDVESDQPEVQEDEISSTVNLSMQDQIDNNNDNSDLSNSSHNDNVLPFNDAHLRQQILFSMYEIDESIYNSLILE